MLVTVARCYCIKIYFMFFSLSGPNINSDLSWAMPNSQTSLCIFKIFYFNSLSLENNKFKLCFLDADKVIEFIIK